MAKQSIISAQRATQAEERKAAKAYAKDAAKRGSVDISGGLRTATGDSFQNFLLGMGMGTDNANSANSYGFNPITRNRMLCEWIYRGSWIGGVSVDVPANDLTRTGIEHPSQMAPEDTGKLDRCAKRLNIWREFNRGCKWGRLYGGAVCVALIDGQDMRTPLDVKKIGPGQFRGLATLDRWMVDPTLNDLVTELGPHMGQPKFYRVLANAPFLRGAVIHHSRIMLRHTGIELPYQQAMTENLWGLSIFERLYDRLTAFDMATTGAAQLINKCYIRTMKIEGLRQIVAAGGQPYAGLLSFMAFVRRTQGIEGLTLLDQKDEFVSESHQAFSGLDSIIHQFAQQIAGAVQIPMVRLFGQSPGGLNATGEGDERIYYDNLAQEWENTLMHGVQTTYQLIAASEGVKVADDFTVTMAPLDQLTDEKKADVANKDVDSVTKALDASLISEQTALRELKQSSRRTGRFSNITQEMIDQASDEIEQAPSPLELMKAEAEIKSSQTAANDPNEDATDKPVPGAEDDEEAGQKREARSVADRLPRRVGVRRTAA